MDKYSEVRGTDFRNNSLCWAALIHFLPADLLREYCHVLVDLVSKGTFNLDALFEERLVSGCAGLEYWERRPRNQESDMAQYLQRRLRHFAWGNDSYVVLANAAPLEDALSPEHLEAAIRLGSEVDLQTPQESINQFSFPEKQESISILRDCIAKGAEFLGSSEDNDNLEALERMLSTVAMPLRAVMTKHCGDLCADSDMWLFARQLYDKAHELVSSYHSEPWRPYCRLLEVLLSQSIASALRSTQGSEVAAAYLAPKVESSSVDCSPLFLANASLDSYVAASAGAVRSFVPDHRTTLVLPPLALDSHDVGAALQATVQQKYTEAIRQFWQLLRRQIALGSAQESRITKVLYAKTLFEDLREDLDNRYDPRAFSMAVRLMIESGQTYLAETLKWTEVTVRSYVTSTVIAEAIERAKYSVGTRSERMNTVVELLAGWALAAPVESTSLTEEIVTFLAKTARENPTSFYGSEDIGGRSIRYIRKLAETRPEMRAATSRTVVEAIVGKLRQGEWWTGVREALETATLYADVFSDEEMSKTIDGTLGLLAQMDPAKAPWVLVRPALGFLTSSTIKGWLFKHDSLPALDAILQFGVGLESEHARLLFFFQDFDFSRLRDPNHIQDQLSLVVSDLEQKARATNASSAPENIQALLAAPAISGRAGIKAALESLETILRAALKGKPTLAFPLGYAALLQIAARFHEIAAALSLSEDEFGQWLEGILAALKDVWVSSRERPMMFAHLSLPPPTKPNSVIVHNWAFASISLAKALNRETEILQVLQVAEGQPLLAESIGRARAMRLAASDFSDIDASAIRSEGQHAFYAALGQRLVRLRDLTNRTEILQALLHQCLRYGPNGLDCGVLLLAADLRTGHLSDFEPDLSNYSRRLENDRQLRLSLSPLFGALTKTLDSSALQ